jgi:mannan endo-1,4-beta-mannosidase
LYPPKRISTEIAKKLRLSLWAAMGVVLLQNCQFNTDQAPLKSSDITYIKNGKFHQNGKTLLIKGCNYWYGGYLVSKNDTQSYQRLISELNFLQKQGINNLRVMVSSEGDSRYPYRISPSLRPSLNRFNTEMLYGFDVLLSELHQRNMTAVMVLGNNWEWSGGFGEYLHWHENQHGKPILPKTSNWHWDSFSNYLAQFYSCDYCKTNYRETINRILHRQNSIDRIPYREHPAILSCELANEPRPMLRPNWDSYVNWIQQTSAFIHSIDSNHLITIGQEGFISLFNDPLKFEEIHNLTHIDYATIHIWPKTWNWYNGDSKASVTDTTLEKTGRYIQQHAQICQKINKPLIIEEFGLHRDGNIFNPESSVHNRNTYYQFVLNYIKQNKLAGFNFWGGIALSENVNENGFMTPGSAYSADPPQEEQGLYGVYKTDSSTWKIIRNFNR